MRELIIGAVALAVLSVIFGLVGRHAPERPRGSCGGCALASVCDKRPEREGAGDSQECWVGDDGDAGTSP